VVCFQRTRVKKEKNPIKEEIITPSSPLYRKRLLRGHPKRER